MQYTNRHRYISKSYISKSFYIRSKSLHALPKFTPTTQRIKVGNGQYVAVLFIIPVIIEVYGHRFEVVTLVSEIHGNVDLVLGMKNAYEFRRYNRYVRFLIQIFKWISTIFLQRTSQ